MENRDLFKLIGVVDDRGINGRRLFAFGSPVHIRSPVETEASRLMARNVLGGLVLAMSLALPAFARAQGEGPRTAGRRRRGK